MCTVTTNLFFAYNIVGLIFKNHLGKNRLIKIKVIKGKVIINKLNISLNLKGLLNTNA